MVAFRNPTPASDPTARRQFQKLAHKLEMELASPYARVELTANETISNNSQTAVPWDRAYNDDAEEWDPYGFWVSGSATRLSVPAGLAGVYVIQFGGVWEADSTGLRRLNITKNGTATEHGEWKELNPSGSSQARGNVVTILPMDDGDYVEALVYQNSGGDLDVVNNTNTTFRMTKIGRIAHKPFRIW